MAYIYQADVWCDSCGDAIKEKLDNEGKTPEDMNCYDSDDYPKYFDGEEETDCPHHCAAGASCHEAEILPSGDKIGCLLGTNLTDDGGSYLREKIEDGGEVAEFWKEQFSHYLD